MSKRPTSQKRQPQPAPKKYLGMTAAQLILAVGVGFVLLAIIIGGLVIITLQSAQPPQVAGVPATESETLDGAAAPAAASTSAAPTQFAFVLPPTWTPTVTSTATFTPTPTLVPTATPIPSLTPTTPATSTPEGASPANIDFSEIDTLETTLQSRIEVGSSDSATLDDFLEAHNWTFTGTDGQIVVIRVDGRDDADPLVKLIDPDGNVLARNDDGDDGLNALVTMVLPIDGIYTVRVGVFAPGTYDISVTNYEGDLPIEIDFSRIDIYETTLQLEIEVGSSDSATLDSLLEAHNWTFTGVAGQRVIIRVNGQDEADPRASLIDPFGNVVKSDDDSGGGFDVLIRVTLFSDGTYTVRVDMFRTGTYEISVE